MGTRKDGGGAQGGLAAVFVKNRRSKAVLAPAVWRCHPDLNWGWSFCRALPYHLAMAPSILKYAVERVDML